MLQNIALIELLLCWIAWAMSFLKPAGEAAGQVKVERDRGARWGIVLESIGFACVWLRVRPENFEKSALALIASMILAPLAVVLVWMATRHLGKQWRYDAALIENHELIRTGPYAFVRHPIYTSLFGMLLATGFAWTWWPMMIAGVIFFLIGTEIRVRAEDRLLAGRFGPSFEEYRARVRAYLPFVR